MGWRWVVKCSDSTYILHKSSTYRCMTYKRDKVKTAKAKYTPLFLKGELQRVTGELYSPQSWNYRPEKIKLAPSPVQWKSTKFWSISRFFILGNNSFFFFLLLFLSSYQGSWRIFHFFFTLKKVFSPPPQSKVHPYSFSKIGPSKFP